MTLKAHIAQDLDRSFFSEKDFAEEAEYRPAAAAPFPLNVLFDDPYSQVEPGGMGAIQAQAIRVQAAAKSFPQPPGPGDMLFVRGTEYRVISAQPDGVGLMTLSLHEDS